MNIVISQIIKSGGTAGLQPIVEDNTVTGFGKLSCVVPEGVTQIGNNAFAYCSALGSITLPDSLTQIGEWAFAYCSALESITLPDSLPYFTQQMFGGAGQEAMQTLNIPQGWKPTAKFEQWGNYEPYSIMFAFPSFSKEYVIELVGKLGEWQNEQGESCTITLHQNLQNDDADLQDLYDAIAAKGYQYEFIS